MAEEQLPWFACYPSKWLDAFAAMKPDQGWVYFIVVLRIYDKRGPISDTIDALARRTGFRPTHVAKVIDQLCSLGKLKRLPDGGLMNPFAEREISKGEKIAIATAKNKSRAGKISAEKRKQNQAQISTGVKQEPTHLHLHKQDSLFTDVNRALPDPKEKPPKPHRQPTSVEIARKEFFDRGKVVLGEAAGGMLQSLLAVKHGNIALARAALEQASTMDNPRQYIGGILRGGLNGKTENAIGGFSGLGAKLRQAVADEERDSFDPAPDR